MKIEAYYLCLLLFLGGCAVDQTAYDQARMQDDHKAFCANAGKGGPAGREGCFLHQKDAAPSTVVVPNDAIECWD